MRIISLLLLLCFTNSIFADGFVKNSLVKTKNGHVFIEEIEPNDYVMSCDFTDKCVERKVLAKSIKKAASIVKIIISGKEIIASADHLFYLPKQNIWQKASDLILGDTLLNANYDQVQIDTIEFLNEKIDTYSLSVEGEHNFYISDASVLVHNFVLMVPLITWTIGEGIAILGGGATLIAIGAAIAS